MASVAADFWLGQGAREAAGSKAILPERGDTAKAKKRRNPEGKHRLVGPCQYFNRLLSRRKSLWAPPVRPTFRAMSDKTPALEVRDLTKTYPGPRGGTGLTVLKGVSFVLPAGDSLAIVGPSGSGKTTLLGLCAGLDRATSGSVVLAGIALDALDEDERARVRNDHTGFVFQNFQLVPTLTALENVMVPAELRPPPAGQSRRAVLKERGQLAAELLAAVGLGDRFDHYPTQLSGGEQQRVALARAFVNRPRILFADEPTGNLDAETSDRVLDVLFELNRSANTALVLVTHNLELAARVHRILRMKDGAVVI